MLRRAIRISAMGQHEVMKLMKPEMGEMDVQGLHEYVCRRYGAGFNAPNQATQEVVADGLTKLGIIKKKDEFRRYYPHGASHYPGLDVHDRGSYGPL